MRQGQNDIVGMDHAQVAVNGTGGIQNVSTGAGRVKGAGDLLTDISGFSCSSHGDAAGTTTQQLDGL